jgi:hypothetical protein
MKINTKKVDKAEQILLALLEHPTRAQAAASLGISPSTLWRWLQKPEFRERYRVAKRAAYSYALGRMLYAAPNAITVLRSISQNQKVSFTSRLAASKCLLKHADRLALEDVQAQYDNLSSGDGRSRNPRKRTKLVLVGGDATARKTNKVAEHTERITVTLLQ